jgi:hypothetical protein
MAKMSIEITIDRTKLDEVRRRLDGIKGAFERATVGAVSTTSRRLVTFISSGIRDEVNVKKKDIDPYLRGTKATKYQKSARAKVILSESDRISLKDFGAKVIKKSKPARNANLHTMTTLQRMKLAGGVRYQVNRRGGKKLIRDAFIPPRLGGHVFRRAGLERLPIVKLFGPSPWGVFVASGMKPRVKGKAEELLYHELDRRVHFELLKYFGEV